MATATSSSTTTAPVQRSGAGMSRQLRRVAESDGAALAGAAGPRASGRTPRPERRRPGGVARARGPAGADRELGSAIRLERARAR